MAIEPLLRQYQRNENIQPITLNPGDEREVNINNFDCADDITGLFKKTKEEYKSSTVRSCI